MVRKIGVSVKKAFASLALLSFELLAALVLFIAALFVFAWFVNLIFNHQNEIFDLLVFERLDSVVSPSLTEFMLTITSLGNHKFLIPANLILIVYFLFIKKHKWYSIKVPVIALGGVSIMLLLKEFFNRERPVVPLLEPVAGLSFPSGHALMSMSFYGLLIIIVWEQVKNKTWKWVFTTLLLLLIFLIGFSRIYLRLHYFSDVMAGFAMGIIWLSLSIWVVSRIERYSRRKMDPIVSEQVAK